MSKAQRKSEDKVRVLEEYLKQLGETNRLIRERNECLLAMLSFSCHRERDVHSLAANAATAVSLVAHLPPFPYSIPPK